MSFFEGSVYTRRFHLLMNCCSNPVVIIDGEGRIKEFNSRFLQVISQGAGLHCELKEKMLFSYLDDITKAEIRKILRQRSMVGNFSFNGCLVVGNYRTNYIFRANYYCDEDYITREVMLILEPRTGGLSGIEPGSLIKYLGEVFLPQVPLTSQIIGTNKKVLYSVNWEDLPFPLRQEVKENEKICCSLLRRSKRRGECICEKTLREGKTSIEEVCVGNNSDPIWLVFVVIPIIGEDNLVYGVLSTVNNITEERRLAKSVEEYINVLQKNLVDSQLLPALIRHLREPISYILGGISLLLDENSRNNPQVLLKMKAKCEECREIINQVGNFSSELPEAFIKAEVNALVRSMVLPVFSNSGDKKVIFRFTPFSVYISCVPHQFAQALIAVIDNGLRYASKEVLVSLNCEGEEIFISIDDDGKGISSELMPRIFTPFFTTDKEKGHLGLGLSLARSIVESIGGYLSVGQSKYGGANFIIRLPIVEVIPTGEVKKEKKDHNILIVEDDEDLAEILKTSLEKEGYSVYVSHSCKKAKELLYSHHISFILLDLLFAEEPTGFDFYEEVTKKEKFPEERILVITGDSSTPSTKKFLKSIRSQYLEKPFDLDKLKMVIAKNVEGE